MTKYEIILGERQTAGKRIKVYTLHNPGHKGNPTEVDMIQEMADAGYNFAGLIRSTIPEGFYGWPSHDYLFIKADD